MPENASIGPCGASLPGRAVRHAPAARCPHGATLPGRGAAAAVPAPPRPVSRGGGENRRAAGNVSRPIAPAPRGAQNTRMPQRPAPGAALALAAGAAAQEQPGFSRILLAGAFAFRAPRRTPYVFAEAARRRAATRAPPVRKKPATGLEARGFRADKRDVRPGGSEHVRRPVRTAAAATRTRVGSRRVRKTSLSSSGLV